jgi:hypothetical protein
LKLNQIGCPATIKKICRIIKILYNQGADIVKISSENFIAEISIDVTKDFQIWSGIGKLDRKVEPGKYMTNIGKILIIYVREDLTFIFVIIEKIDR